MRGSGRSAAGDRTTGLRLSRVPVPRSRLVSVAVIAVLLATVTALRWFYYGAGEAVALLYVVPIALGALRFGRRGGAVMAGFGITAFVVLEAVHGHGDLDMSGWVGPLLAMAIVGGLVGHLSSVADLQEADRRLQAQQIEELRDAQRSAAQAGDSIVQQVAAARWMLESGLSEEAFVTLDNAVAEGIAEVSGALPPLPREPTAP